jgi:hypothetical protein
MSQVQHVGSPQKDFINTESTGVSDTFGFEASRRREAGATDQSLAGTSTSGALTSAGTGDGFVRMPAMLHVFSFKASSAVISLYPYPISLAHQRQRQPAEETGALAHVPPPPDAAHST